LSNSAFDRSYPFTFAISSTNTYEYKTITIPGDTSGTWLTTNGIGIRLCISLGEGSDRKGTAGAWAAGAFLSATGTINLISNSGATFYITGVQLEKGSVATPFEFRSIGQELALCQRYYQKSYPQGVTPGTATTLGGYDVYSPVSGTGAWFFPARFSVVMRAAPTVTVYDATGAAGFLFKGANGKIAALFGLGDSGVVIGTTDATNANELFFQFTSSAEL
jgi:hypothetical protein